MFAILLVRTSSIGDVIQTLPALEYVRAKFPHAQIDWVVEKGIAPLLRQIELSGQSRPPIDRVLTANSKSWSKAPFSSLTRAEIKKFYGSLREVDYDILFDLQGNTKSALITALARAKEKIGFGWKSVRERTNLLVTSKRFEFPPEINIRLKYLGLLQSYFEDAAAFVSAGVRFRLFELEQIRLEQIFSDPCLQRTPRFMVAVGSKWKNKRLNEETLQTFLKKVVDHIEPSFLFIYGNPEEKCLAEKLQSAFPDRSQAIGDLSLPLWQELMWKVDGVIAVDSAALHLAGTTRTPTFSVFGPTTADLFKPFEERHYAYQGTCPYGRRFIKQCPILRTCSTGACIRDVSDEVLFQSFKHWYGRV